MIQLNIRFFLTLLLAIVLTIIPLPGFFIYCRPPWVLLVILYIQYFFPALFSLTLSLALGMILDVLLATPLCEHAVAFVITSWIAKSQIRQFQLYSLPNQLIIVSVLSCIYQFILYLIDIQQGFGASLFAIPGTGLASFLVWPWVDTLLRRNFVCSRRFVRKIQ